MWGWTKTSFTGGWNRGEDRWNQRQADGISRERWKNGIFNHKKKTDFSSHKGNPRVAILFPKR